MLTPEYLLQISEGGEEIAERIHQYVIKQIIDRIVLRLDRGDGSILTARDKWQIQTLQEAGYLLEDIQKEIAQKTGLMQKEIAEAMEDAGVKAMEYDDSVYRAAGLSPKPLEQSPHLIRLMQSTYEATLGDWKNFTGTFADAAQQSFIRAMDNAYTQVASGSMSYSEALVEAVNNIVSDGVVVEYPSGHTDTIETATLRCIRTGVSQATGRIQLARMEEMGIDLVLVSSHLGARPEHQLWQGKIYSRSGNDPKYPDFVEATQYGTVTGLCGANCRHNFGPYIEGMHNPFEDYDSEENQKAYETQQRQRTLERRIRKTKRECMGLQEAVSKAESPEAVEKPTRTYERKAALLAKQNAAYNEYCEQNGLKRLSERLTIAKWDRSQAAKARAAAKRYAVDHPDSAVPKEYKPRAKKVEKIPEKKLTIFDINNKAGENLLEIYENRREHFGLNLVPASDLRGSDMNPITADYTGVSVETAYAFNDTITELSSKYYSGFTKIEVADIRKMPGWQEFATTSHMNTVGQKTLILNPVKVKDYDSMVSRIGELSQKGYAVKIKPGTEGRYIATHEFAHSLMDMKSPLKNYVGMDTRFQTKARKEIEDIFKEYQTEVGAAEKKRRSLELEFIMASDTARMAEIQKELLGFKTGKISNYSLVNSDEFLAEAFTDCMIGADPSEYSKRVLAVLDRYFKR